MGSWNEILKEVSGTESPYDKVRRSYLKALSGITGRNVVAYYSGWLQKTGEQFFNITSITDEDKLGFMSCFYQIDREKGLDLVIHSPGGLVTATESLIHYLRQMFGSNIRVFIPQLAMSGGTILALAGNEIWLGKHSNLGPIDPQFGSVPAVTLIDEVNRAYEEIQKDPGKINIWAPILSQISPSFLTQAQQAIDLSRSIAVEALVEGMFRGQDDARRKAEKIAEALTNTDTHKAHSRHIHADDCRKLGLKIIALESNHQLQDAVLSVHHSFMITLSNSQAAKIIENQNGAAFIKNVPPEIFPVGSPLALG